MFHFIPKPHKEGKKGNFSAQPLYQPSSSLINLSFLHIRWLGGLES